MTNCISIYLFLSKYYMLDSLNILNLLSLILNQMWQILPTEYVKLRCEGKMAVPNKDKSKTHTKIHPLFKKIEMVKQASQKLFLWKVSGSIKQTWPRWFNRIYLCLQSEWAIKNMFSWLCLVIKLRRLRKKEAWQKFGPVNNRQFWAYVEQKSLFKFKPSNYGNYIS